MSVLTLHTIHRRQTRPPSHTVLSAHSITDMSNNLHAYLLCWLKETKKMPKRGPRSLRAICVRKVQRYLDLKRKLEPANTKELGTAATSQPHRSQNLRLAYPGEQALRRFAFPPLAPVHYREGLYLPSILGRLVLLIDIEPSWRLRSMKAVVSCGWPPVCLSVELHS